LIITYTKHAEINAIKRKISNEMVENVVLNPLIIETDKYDGSLIHFIGYINNKYLRIIGRKTNEDELMIISVFFDRRIKRKYKNV
jgi:hypothetical protein